MATKCLVSYASDIVPHAAGIPLQVRFGNQVVERRGVNARLQEKGRGYRTCLLARCAAGTWTSGDLLRLAHEYWLSWTPMVNNGNVLALEIEMLKPGGTRLWLRQTHSYDGQSRLVDTTQTESLVVSWKITNGYSATGNRYVNPPLTTVAPETEWVA